MWFTVDGLVTWNANEDRNWYHSLSQQHITVRECRPFSVAFCLSLVDTNTNTPTYVSKRYLSYFFCPLTFTLATPDVPSPKHTHMHRIPLFLASDMTPCYMPHLPRSCSGFNMTHEEQRKRLAQLSISTGELHFHVRKGGGGGLNMIQEKSSGTKVLVSIIICPLLTTLILFIFDVVHVGLGITWWSDNNEQLDIAGTKYTLRFKPKAMKLDDLHFLLWLLCLV